MFVRTEKPSKAPIFTTDLEETLAYVNKSLTLTCEVTALPRPNIRWFRWVKEPRPICYVM